MRWAAGLLFASAATLTVLAIAAMGNGCQGGGDAWDALPLYGAGVCLAAAVITLAPREDWIRAAIFGVIAGVVLDGALLAASLLVWGSHCAN